MPTATLTCICAWCRREEVDGTWRAPRAAATSAPVTHGICDTCAEIVLRAASTRD